MDNTNLNMVNLLGMENMALLQVSPPALDKKGLDQVNLAMANTGLAQVSLLVVASMDLVQDSLQAMVNISLAQMGLLAMANLGLEQANLLATANIGLALVSPLGMTVMDPDQVSLALGNMGLTQETLLPLSTDLA